MTEQRKSSCQKNPSFNFILKNDILCEIFMAVPIVRAQCGKQRKCVSAGECIYCGIFRESSTLS